MLAVSNGHFSNGDVANGYQVAPTNSKREEIFTALDELFLSETVSYKDFSRILECFRKTSRNVFESDIQTYLSVTPLSPQDEARFYCRAGDLYKWILNACNETEKKEIISTFEKIGKFSSRTIHAKQIDDGYKKIYAIIKTMCEEEARFRTDEAHFRTEMDTFLSTTPQEIVLLKNRIEALKHTSNTCLKSLIIFGGIVVIGILIFICVKVVVMS